jgi:hypothetical protein
MRLSGGPIGSPLQVGAAIEPFYGEDAGAKLAALRRTHFPIAAQIVKATTEVVSRPKGDWTADIAAYDQGHAHMLMFADMLADGILEQFPAKFSK